MEVHTVDLCVISLALLRLFFFYYISLFMGRACVPGHLCVRGQLELLVLSFHRESFGQALSHLAGPIPGFLCGFWVSNLGPHTCTESMLGTESSPQPSSTVFQSREDCVWLYLPLPAQGSTQE